MSEIILGLGDVGVTNRPDGVLKTFGLGSCVALIMVDLKTKTVGMAHVVLPDSQIDKERSKQQPGYAADTAVPYLLEAMKKAGCGNRIVAKLVGGAQIMSNETTFNIGKRNALAIKKALWRHRMAVMGEDLGKDFSRTVAVSTQGGIVISSPGKENWEI